MTETKQLMGARVILNEGKDGPDTQFAGSYNIRSNSIIYRGCNIGDNFSTGHCVLIRNNSIIGSNVSIGSFSEIAHDVKIGNNTRIHSRVFIPEFTNIEDDVWIGPAVVFTNSKYPNTPKSKQNLMGVTVKKGAIICAASVILPGVVIGERCIIGAGSLVSKDTEPGWLYIGSPAKKSKQVSEITYENGEHAYE